VIPLIIKIIHGKKAHVDRSEYMNDDAYDNIFVAFVLGKGDARILQLKYGEPTPIK
jgi:hypothetical protein